MLGCGSFCLGYLHSTVLHPFAATVSFCLSKRPSNVSFRFRLPSTSLPPRIVAPAWSTYTLLLLVNLPIRADCGRLAVFYGIVCSMFTYCIDLLRSLASGNATMTDTHCPCSMFFYSFRYRISKVLATPKGQGFERECLDVATSDKRRASKPSTWKITHARSCFDSGGR